MLVCTSTTEVLYTVIAMPKTKLKLFFTTISSTHLAARTNDTHQRNIVPVPAIRTLYRNPYKYTLRIIHMLLMHHKT